MIVLNPTRPAPAPPTIGVTIDKQTPGPQQKFVRNSSIDQFKLSRSQSAGKLEGSKKPPPRPPPPKQHPSLSKIFIHQKSRSSLKKCQTSGSLKTQLSPTSLLIDFTSPPSSPIKTTHSSSDSFGSSQVESGFEDDFDELLLSNVTTPSITDISSDDPFGNITFSNHFLHVPFELSNEDPRCKHKTFTLNVSTSVKPTIIRTKNTKPSRPPPPKLRPSSTPPFTFVCSPTEDWSPPMPNCPPPPPPPEVLETLQNGPSLPPRPSNIIQEGLKLEEPHCIALYDYTASHPDDLSFKVNDVISLQAQVNNDWLKGSINGNVGIFPTSYVNVVVPLPELTKYVLAVFNFTPESWDDLPFQEGDTIKVIKRVNEDWLFGECNGKQGMLPASYVTDILPFVPLQSSSP